MNTISLRLYPETEQRYKEALDRCDAGTNGRPATADQFINYLLECEANPRKVEVSKQTDLDKIEQLQQKVLQLESELNNQASTSNDFSGRVTELEHKLFSAESELTILREKQGLPVLESDQLIIRLFPEQLKMIAQYQYSILQKTGEEPTASELFVALLNKGHIKNLPK